MRTSVARLIDFLAGTRLEDIPADVIENARLSFLDTAGCIVGGMEAHEVSRLAESVAVPDGPVRIVGTAHRSAAMPAAFVEAVAGTWYDLDTGHRHPSSDPPVPAIQPPVHIVPALLVSAPQRRASGAELLRAYILSYELAARLGVASRLRQGLHGHGAHPTVGAAVAAALVGGATREALAAVASCAQSICVMADMAPAIEGATVRNVYAAVGAANGLLASELAGGAFIPPADPWTAILDGPLSDRIDAGAVIEGLGTDWEATKGYIKVHACCRWNHPALDALEDLAAAEGPVAAADVERVEIETFLFASRLTNQSPVSELGAKFSLPYAVSAFFVLRSTGWEAFTPRNLWREDVRDFARRVVVREKPEYSAALPARRPTTVHVHLRDGRRLSASVDGSRGDPSRPFSREAIEAKFRSLATVRLGGEGAERAVTAMRRVEEIADAGEIVDLLSPAAR